MVANENGGATSEAAVVDAIGEAAAAAVEAGGDPAAAAAAAVWARRETDAETRTRLYSSRCFLRRMKTKNDDAVTVAVAVAVVDCGGGDGWSSRTRWASC